MASTLSGPMAAACWTHGHSKQCIHGCFCHLNSTSHTSLTLPAPLYAGWPGIYSLPLVLAVCVLILYDNQGTLI